MKLYDKATVTQNRSIMEKEVEPGCQGAEQSCQLSLGVGVGMEGRGLLNSCLHSDKNCTIMGSFHSPRLIYRKSPGEIIVTANCSQ